MTCRIFSLLIYQVLGIKCHFEDLNPALDVSAFLHVLIMLLVFFVCAECVCVFPSSFACPAASHLSMWRHDLPFMHDTCGVAQRLFHGHFWERWAWDKRCLSGKRGGGTWARIKMMGHRMKTKTTQNKTKQRNKMYQNKTSTKT